MIKPYVGIASVTSQTEAEEIARMFLESGFSADNNLYQGALGYAITWKMLCGQEQITTRYLSPAQMKDIMLQNQNFGINILHFVPKPEASEQLLFDIKKILLDHELYELGLCHTIQINYGFSIPSDAIAKLKDSLPDLKIILQIGRAECEDTPIDLCIEKIRGYADSVDLFLFDPSQGTGTQINHEKISNLLKEFARIFPNQDVGFAGGLNPENVQKYINEFKLLTNRDFSIDVESGIRKKEDDQLDLEKTRAFITNAASQLLKI